MRTIEIHNRNSSTFRNYKVIYYSIPYLFIIREIGGIATGAYVNGSNPNYSENIYRDSNVGVEGYLIELGYMNVDEDLRNVLNNGDEALKFIKVYFSKHADISISLLLAAFILYK